MNETKNELTEKQAAAVMGGQENEPVGYGPSQLIWVERCGTYAEVQDGVCKSKSGGPSCCGCEYNK